MDIIFYIAATAGDTWDKFIAEWTHGPYSHVELCFSDGMCFSSSPRDGGTRFKQIAIDPTHWTSFPINVTLGQEKQIRDWCAAHVGCKYDWIGIISLGLDFPIRTPHRWYCSEVCIMALDVVKIVDFKSLISPNKFYELLNKV